MQLYQSTLSVEESDQPREGRERPCVDFNPRLRGESDFGKLYCNAYAFKSFNPRSPWGERRLTGRRLVLVFKFSIHASVGRATIARNGAGSNAVLIHASVGERRGLNWNQAIRLFQSTLSVGGERQQTYPKCCVAVWIDFLIFEKDAYKIKQNNY